ncbi:hypothetical protein [Sporomusa sphaeroides]|uniref:hypothetical protein n=1 Tax=Sporomusa sphaeroides TaxID=47679 RepID=UPI00315803E0
MFLLARRAAADKTACLSSEIRIDILGILISPTLYDVIEIKPCRYRLFALAAGRGGQLTDGCPPLSGGHETRNGKAFRSNYSER